VNGAIRNFKGNIAIGLTIYAYLSFNVWRQLFDHFTGCLTLPFRMKRAGAKIFVVVCLGKTAQS
jgi:hypothetical protein